MNHVIGVESAFLSSLALQDTVPDTPHQKKKLCEGCEWDKRASSKITAHDIYEAEACRNFNKPESIDNIDELWFVCQPQKGVEQAQRMETETWPK